MSRAHTPSAARVALSWRVGALLIAVLGMLALPACSETDTGLDLGVVEPGCRAPSACYSIGADCSCARGELETKCKVCDPAAQLCICASYQRCVQGPEVCVGRSASVCGGSGARCLPSGGSCASSGGDPPNLVGTGPNGTLEPRCSFVDDVCCPGTSADAGMVEIPDAG